MAKMAAFLASLLARMCSIAGKIRETLMGLPPPFFAGYLFFGAAMIVFTAAANLLTIPAGQGRFKGYWWELNWGVNHLAVIPVALFCCSWVLRTVPRQVTRIARAGMAVDGRFTPLSEDALRADWGRYEPGPGWLGVIALFAFVTSWGEWLFGCAIPLARPAAAPPAPNLAVGWTAGALLDPGHISVAANLVLGFVAYTAQGLVVTIFCYSFAMVLGFSTWLYTFTDGNKQFVPNPGSADVRRGFEMFEPLVLNMLFMALAFAFVLFFIRIQSVYDYSESKAPTVYHFLLDDVVKGFFTNMAQVFQGGQLDLWDVGKATDFGTVMVSAAMCAMLTIVIVVPTLILYVLAWYSRESLEECLQLSDCPPCTSHGLTKSACQASMNTMDFWPLRYPRPMELLAYVVFAGFCFLFYKFTFVLVGILALRMVQFVYRGLTTPAQTSPPGGAPAAPAQPTAPPVPPPPAPPPAAH
jgi:hypothetical protein